MSANWLLVGAVVACQGVHIVSMFIPRWQDVLGVEPVAITTWATLLGITLSKFIIVEAYKYLRGRALAERIYHGLPLVGETAGESDTSERAGGSCIGLRK